MLVGPTYCGRLWCVLELFTFMHMGGQSDRVIVRITGDAGGQIETQLATFDALQATCFKPEEAQRLLGIIEVAFGDFSAFNAAVRAIFAERGFGSSRKVDKGMPATARNRGARRGDQVAPHAASHQTLGLAGAASSMQRTSGKVRAEGREEAGQGALAYSQRSGSSSCA